MTSDLDLLGRFANDNAQDAFAEIVRRHLNLVYSAALRQVRAPQLAEEIAQSVFTDLARRAGILPVNETKSLAPWLYSVTRRTAIDVIRKESRRQLREQIAVEMNDMNATESGTGVSPVWAEIEIHLDDAMAALDETDRVAILLRYFENKNLREIGDALKISDDAAQKRVSRAVEKLREFFSKQKITIGASGLAVLISANAVQAAPVGLAATILAATSGITVTFGMTMIHKILIAGFAAAAIGSGIYSFHLQKQISALQQEQASLNQQIAHLSSERDDIKKQLASVEQENEHLQNNQDELLKLRGETGVLRRQLGEATGKNRALPAVVVGMNTHSSMPQIHIKAKFLTMPNDVLAGLGGLTSFDGVLTSEDASNVLREVESRNGVETLAEPEAVTMSGRQVQMRAGQTIPVVTNFCLQETNGASSIVPQIGNIEMGSVLDALPRVLPDGYTIELPVIASVTEFLGYAQSTNTTPAYNSAGQEIDVPTASPQFRMQSITNSVNLFDNQTLVFALNDAQVPAYATTAANATFLQSDGSKSNSLNRQTLVFVTATIIDPAGNRVHEGASYTNIPPQAAEQ